LGAICLPGGAEPLPRLVALTHVVIVPNRMAICFYSSLSVRPCSRNSFTASSRISGVHVLGFVICVPVGEACQKGVSEKIRAPHGHMIVTRTSFKADRFVVNMLIFYCSAAFQQYGNKCLQTSHLICTKGQLTKKVALHKLVRPINPMFTLDFL
jgi:hypothetical protein